MAKFVTVENSDGDQITVTAHAAHHVYGPKGYRTVGDTPEPDGDGLDGMTVAELQALADTEGIDLGDATKKADIIAAIRDDDGGGATE